MYGKLANWGQSLQMIWNMLCLVHLHTMPISECILCHISDHAICFWVMMVLTPVPTFLFGTLPCDDAINGCHRWNTVLHPSQSWASLRWFEYMNSAKHMYEILLILSTCMLRTSSLLPAHKASLANWDSNNFLYTYHGGHQIRTIANFSYSMWNVCHTMWACIQNESTPQQHHPHITSVFKFFKFTAEQPHTLQSCWLRCQGLDIGWRSLSWRWEISYRITLTSKWLSQSWGSSNIFVLQKVTLDDRLWSSFPFSVSSRGADYHGTAVSYLVHASLSHSILCISPYTKSTYILVLVHGERVGYCFFAQASLPTNKHSLQSSNTSNKVMWGCKSDEEKARHRNLVL